MSKPIYDPHGEYLIPKDCKVPKLYNSANSKPKDDVIIVVDDKVNIFRLVKEKGPVAPKKESSYTVIDKD